ncbi:alpha/beta hydrolase [Alsobacter sp. SYSU M60028]|uniref:Alpha/beta hydrolase n=1 Tax=Alsobacter ponti TaxID=2962936 RepID=A0ABT1L7C0_9HYPH|nr:alpha/beta hydrolase [Alsobacter ponti]MCP8937367.1 alpha/beta hydrolase [Alsobacter ponti]
MASPLAFGRLDRTWQRGRAPARAAACRPAFGELVAVPENPLPPGLSAGVLRTADGVGLRIAASRPAGRPRGSVLLLQGRADFIEKYAEVIAELNARGFAVLAFDWRGQGGSQRLLPDPLRNHASGFAAFGLDLAALRAELHRLDLPGPAIGLAHSMGAAVLLTALAREPGLVERAVVTAPMIAIAPQLRPPFAAGLTRLAHAAGFGARTIPGPSAKGMPGAVFTPDNLLTSDARRYLRSHHVLAARPQLAVGKPTIGWLHAAFAGMAGLRDPALAAALATPLLCVAGEDDRVTHTQAAARFVARLPCGEMLVLPGCAHDVLMERDGLRARFWQAFDRFVADL